MHQRLRWIVLLTIVAICALLYWNTRSLAKMGIVLLAVPFSCVGAIWLLYLAGYHFSLPVWVGLIALIGVDAQTGVFMLLYLDLAWASAEKGRQLRSHADRIEAIVEGAAHRIRPKVMTVATMSIGLMPVLFTEGTGSGIMKRIAAPLIGGLITSFAVELLVYPVIYGLFVARQLSPRYRN